MTYSRLHSANCTLVAGFLMALDAKVAGVTQAVATAEKWKKRLSQQMFV